MIEVDGAVLIDMDQGTGLIEMCQRKGDAEFDWRYGNAALEQGVGGVPGGNLVAACGVIRALA